MDIQPHEIETCKLAGKIGGEYLDSIGKYDLSKLTPEEYQTYIQCVCMAWEENKTPF